MSTSRRSNDDKEKPTTQAEILDTLGIPYSNGVCSPITNSYVRGLFSKNNGIKQLVGDHKELYKKIRHEEIIQNQLYRDGDDADHSGFINTGTPYERQIVKTSEVATGEELLNKLGASIHSMIKFPVGSSSHQTYFGQIGRGKCRIFDPNVSGGVKDGSCNELAEQQARKIQSSSSSTGTVLIAKTK